MKIIVLILQNYESLKEGKTMKKQLKLIQFLLITSAISAVVYVVTSIVVGSMCVNLNVQKQNIEKQIANMKIKNEALSVEVDELSDYNNVASVISQEGLSNYNVITLGN